MHILLRWREAKIATTFLEGNFAIFTKILKTHYCMHKNIYHNIIYGNEEREMTGRSEKELKSNPLWYIPVREPYTALQNSEVNLYSPTLQDLPTILLRGKSRNIIRRLIPFRYKVSIYYR